MPRYAVNYCCKGFPSACITNGLMIWVVYYSNIVLEKEGELHTINASFSPKFLLFIIIKHPTYETDYSQKNAHYQCIITDDI